MLTQQHSSETWQESNLHIDLRAGLLAHSPPAAARNHPACANCLISKASLRNTYATARVRGREGAERKVRATTRLYYKKPAGHEQGTRNIVRDICNKTRQFLYCFNAIHWVFSFENGGEYPSVGDLHKRLGHLRDGCWTAKPGPTSPVEMRQSKWHTDDQRLETCHVRTDRMNVWLLNVSFLSSCFSSSLFLQSL